MSVYDDLLRSLGIGGGLFGSGLGGAPAGGLGNPAQAQAPGFRTASGIAAHQQQATQATQAQYDAQVKAQIDTLRAQMEWAMNQKAPPKLTEVIMPVKTKTYLMITRESMEGLDKRLIKEKLDHFRDLGGIVIVDYTQDAFILLDDMVDPSKMDAVAELFEGLILPETQAYRIELPTTNPPKPEKL
jgi:hypothetical protein